MKLLGVAKVLKPRCSLMGKNLITDTKTAVEDGLELEPEADKLNIRLNIRVEDGI